MSQETIYQAVYVYGGGSLREELAEQWRCTPGQARRRQRAVPGHWEADLIIGCPRLVSDHRPGRAQDPRRGLY